jgi:hypothetical protein
MTPLAGDGAAAGQLTAISFVSPPRLVPRAAAAVAAGRSTASPASVQPPDGPRPSGALRGLLKQPPPATTSTAAAAAAAAAAVASGGSGGSGVPEHGSDGTPGIRWE